MHITSYIQFLEKQNKLNEKTIDCYASDMKRYALFVLEQGKDYVEVDETLIYKYLDTLREQGLSDSTISRNISAIRGFYNFINRSGISNINPVADIEMPRKMAVEREKLSAEEVERMFSKINRMTDIGMRDYAMLSLLFETGMKLVELLHLHLTDINLDMNYVKCNETKKRRIIEISAKTSGYIKDYIERARRNLVRGDQSIVFLNYNGDIMTRQGFWKMLKKYQFEAGIEKEINSHTFKKNLIRRDHA